MLSAHTAHISLEQWQRARNLTPQQEEIAFWQAVTLADTNPFADAVAVAASIFNNSFGLSDVPGEYGL